MRPFGCKLELLLVQTHARDRFKASAHRHLKWLCPSIQIGADAHFLTGRWVESVNVDLDLLPCIGFDSNHADLFLCLVFTQRIVNERNEPSDGRCFGLLNVLAKSMKIHFHIKKTIVVMAQSLKPQKPHDSRTDSMTQKWQHFFQK